ncbi:MAG: cell division protein FtsA [Candidatus Omnitrophica bacterium]|nr:cell division protein FtsA [Candidatus Omnitrophota bacterium]
MWDDYICALDLGSSKISVVLAQIRKGRIHNLFFETVPSKAVKRGIIVNPLELSISIDGLLKILKDKSRINFKSIHMSISGESITAKHSQAVIPLAERANKLITSSDIEKVIEQARILGCGLEEEIIHQIPYRFAIDSVDNILNPLGLYSHRLELDLYLVCVRSSFIQNFTRIVNQIGYEIEDLFFSGIATSATILNKDDAQGANLVCDIGADTTEVILFKEGLARDIEILPLGGEDLTQAVAEELKISSELAEEIKINHANIGEQDLMKEDKEILLKKGDVYKPIKQKWISQIVTAKAEEIFKDIKDEVEKITASCPIDNFTIVGRTALLEGFLEGLENHLGIPVRLGRIVNPRIGHLSSRYETLSGQRYLTYITPLGIICEVLDRREKSPFYLPQPPKNFICKVIDKIKEVYQEYF